MKNSKGITLTSLIVTVIVMVMLVGIVLLFSAGEEGIIERANEAKRQAEISELKEKIGLEYIGLKNNEANKDKTTSELFTMLDQKMNLDEEFIGNECMIIDLDQDRVITLLEDGTIIEGRMAILNIADGSIDIRSSGFIQGENELIDYEGNYVLTGTTKENNVTISGIGNYNIIIRDLNIDVIEKGLCAFDTNKNRIAEGCHVKIILEGENKLHSGQGAGLQCVGGKIGSETSSSLTLEGNGYLDAKCDGGYCGAGIGGFYTSIPLGNITINSGNYNLKGRTSGSGIGGGLIQPVGKITINGGNIVSKGGYASGIGVYGNEASMECLTINGGVLELAGGEYGGAIGGGKGSGKIVINGGVVNARHEMVYSRNYSTVGNGCLGVQINGGIVNIYSKEGIGIGSNNILPFKLEMTGGNLNVDDKICTMPKSFSKGSLYLTKLKIGDLAKEIKIDAVQKNNNIEYEINNLYTSRDGHLFMLLPEGEVTVSVEAGGKTYTGTIIVTPQNAEVFVLN